ncbi:MAG: amidase, partial [Pelagibacteraceae bacterium]|nr:amidase [Pelagibacteraceae bacterium]
MALATGMTTIATGSDLGGSLRNPAAWSNVVGIRPATGQSSGNRRTRLVLSVHRWTHGGARSTILALQLSVMAGHDSRSPLSINESGAA